MNPREFRALTFDCYGTLIDWESGILKVLRPWAERNGVDAGDEQLLAAFSRTETLCQRDTPAALYPDILRAVHARIAERFGVAPSASDADELADSVGDWPPFADTLPALKRLKRHHKLVIVSNVDGGSFARTNRRLGIEFDAVVTAEQVGAYKPDHRMFHAAFEALDRMGVGRHQALHVAQSLYHDHVPAKALGMKTVWVNRRSIRTGTGATPAPSATVQPDLVVGTLAELAAIGEVT